MDSSANRSTSTKSPQESVREPRRDTEATFRGVQTQVNILKRVRIDVAANEDFVERVVHATLKAAQTGMPGDGKIFVTDLQDFIRIRTGERGSQAIG